MATCLPVQSWSQWTKTQSLRLVKGQLLMPSPLILQLTLYHSPPPSVTEMIEISNSLLPGAYYISPQDASIIPISYTLTQRLPPCMHHNFQLDFVRGGCDFMDPLPIATLIRVAIIIYNYSSNPSHNESISTY